MNKYWSNLKKITIKLKNGEVREKYPCKKCGGSLVPKWDEMFKAYIPHCSACGYEPILNPFEALEK